MKITSTAFSQKAFIPKKYTCAGEDISPALAWQDAPAETKSFALIADDPDAPMGTWIHWVLYNVPAADNGLAEHVPVPARLPGGALQGENSFGKTGYGGPCPPPGHGPHRYYFKLYALDAVLDLSPTDATAETLQKAMKGHVLGSAELMGRYERGKRE